MASFNWTKVPGDELVDALSNGTLVEILPQCSALYVWKRRITVPSYALSSDQDFTKWISGVVEQKSGGISSCELAHCVTLHGLTIGGGRLTPEKERTLTWLASKRKARTYIANVVESLTEVAPPIYVGNANNLCVRMKQHLTDATDLSDYLRDTLELDWRDLELNFLLLDKKPAESNDSKKVQEFLELVSQRVLAPIGTKRPG